jgi:GTP-binding protein Era
MTKKSGFVAIIGETNAGKSTLLNKVIGAKVAITSHKVQTTRFKVLGIHTQKQTQIIFIDTPGIFSPRRRFDKAMVSHSFSQMNDADLILVLLDGNKGITKHFQNITDHLPVGKKAILVINKADLIADNDLDTLNEKLEEYKHFFADTFLISALKKNGLNHLLNYLAQQMPDHEWYFDEDQISDQPLQKLATEITREKVYKFLNQELPYNILVEHNSWKEDVRKIVIHQTIYVVKPSHKMIVLGGEGEKIKSIRLAAMDDMSKVFNKPVSLYLFVKIDDKLFEKQATFDLMGLDFIE